MTKIVRKRKKLNNKGASLVYAMLIMLACTVIASVVLAAATSAAGRVATTSSTDRRYYAVHSAATLIEDVCQDAEFTYKWTYREVKTGTRTTKYYKYSSNVSTTTDKFDDASSKISELTIKKVLAGGTESWAKVNYSSRNNANLVDIFSNASLDLLLGTARTPASIEETFKLADAWDNNKGIVSNLTASGFNITMEGEGVKDIAEKVTMTSKLDGDGKLIVTLSVGEDSDTNRTGYVVKLVFRAYVDDSGKDAHVSEINTGDNSSEDADGNVTITQSINKITDYERIVTYKWYIDSVCTYN